MFKPSLNMAKSNNFELSRLYSTRPYKSRHQRPCDFCRKRKTCCIMTSEDCCLNCVKSNGGICTFNEAPVKRRGRQLTGKSQTKRNLRSRAKLAPQIEVPQIEAPHIEVLEIDKDNNDTITKLFEPIKEGTTNETKSDLDFLDTEFFTNFDINVNATSFLNLAYQNPAYTEIPDPNLRTNLTNSVINTPTPIITITDNTPNIEIKEDIDPLWKTVHPTSNSNIVNFPEFDDVLLKY